MICRSVDAVDIADFGDNGATLLEQNVFVVGGFVKMDATKWFVFEDGKGFKESIIDLKKLKNTL